jgi:hypothetical protein
MPRFRETMTMTKTGIELLLLVLSGDLSVHMLAVRRRNLRPHMASILCCLQHGRLCFRRTGGDQGVGRGAENSRSKEETERRKTETEEAKKPERRGDCTGIHLYIKTYVC